MEIQQYLLMHGLLVNELFRYEDVRLIRANMIVIGSLKEDHLELYTLVRQIMCVPATSALVERVFSQSGLLMRSHPSSFLQVNICILTCLKRIKIFISMSIDNFACK